MTVRVGINGFGRIGRSFTRALLSRGSAAGVELVAVNDPMGDAATMAFLLKHDSVGGTLAEDVKATDGGFDIAGASVVKLDVMDPAEIPWADHGVEVVIESTGLFTGRDAAAAHLKGGAKRVVISAPSGDADATICIGVNDSVYDAAKHTVISNASCTTNCLAPLAKVLNDRFGLERGLMTTVHAYTSDQSLQDLSKADAEGHARPASDAGRGPVDHPQHHWRRTRDRSGAPRAQGAARRHLAARADADGLDHRPVGGAGHRGVGRRCQRRVPEAAGDASYKKVLEYSEEPLVSADIVGNPASCIFSALDTMSNGNMVKVLGWYDNEWGYSNRLIDLVAFVGE